MPKIEIKRRNTRVVTVGQVKIGGNNPIVIQSMTKVPTTDINAAVSQIKELEKTGCELIRVAVPDMAAARSIREIKKHIRIPLVADIHFNYKLALEAITSGADKVRLNPGNIRDRKGVRQVIALAKERNVAVRVGTNVGSVQRNRKNIVDSLVSGVLEHVRILEKNRFYNTVVSVKASDVMTTILAYRKISRIVDYPLHLGVTAAGREMPAIIKSALGIGALLAEGIGDTIRVSLSTDPRDEVMVAKELLQALNLRRFNLEIISCPTCGRCGVNMLKIVKEAEQKLNSVNCKLLTVNSQPIKVAIMGCVVNGPGEARDADFGIACGQGCGIIFAKGKIIKKVSEDKLVETLIKEITRALV